MVDTDTDTGIIDTPVCLPVVFGEALFDQFPDGSQTLGGAPFNVAWTLAGFGFSPLFISRVGDDKQGAYTRVLMQEWGMDMDGLQTDLDYPTGAVSVTLDAASSPSFNIVPNQAYDHIDFDQIEPLLNEKSLAALVHGSLALRSERSRSTLEALIAKHPDLPRFVDVNLRAPWWDRKTVERVITGAALVKLNDDELYHLTGETNKDISSVAELLRARHAIEEVVVTRGELGAVSVSTEGAISLPAPTVKDMVDTVGAGDGFMAAMVAGALTKIDRERLLDISLSFASKICGVRGAQVNDRTFYKPTGQRLKGRDNGSFA